MSQSDGSVTVTVPGVGAGDGGEIAARLRRFLQPQKKIRPGERCEFCGEGLADQHSHVVSVENRGLMCACRPCYLLFTNSAAAGGRYRAVPDRYVFLRDIQISSDQWDLLQIPVGIAFFFSNSEIKRTVAFYPSPAGATESLLPLEAWNELVASSSSIRSLAADVEALLVRRLPDGIGECFIVPIDMCYELVGRMRKSWKGFDGGQEAWADIESFFAMIRERSGEPVASEGSAA